MLVVDSILLVLILLPFASETFQHDRKHVDKYIFLVVNIALLIEISNYAAEYVSKGRSFLYGLISQFKIPRGTFAWPLPHIHSTSKSIYTRKIARAKKMVKKITDNLHLLRFFDNYRYI